MTDTKHLVKLIADVKLQNELKLLTQSSQICQFCQNKAEDEKLERVPKLKGIKESFKPCQWFTTNVYTFSEMAWCGSHFCNTTISRVLFQQV